MQFTEEHNEIRRTVQSFVTNEINPFVADWERDELLPASELARKAGALGLLGINKDPSVGGLGLDYSYQAVFAEEIGTAHDGSTPMFFGVQTMMATPALGTYGSDDLKAEFLVPQIAGERVCSIAVSEPHAGSDVAAIKTTARKDGDDYVINGSKMWITQSTQADFLVTLVNTGDGPIHSNKSLLVVPTDVKGFSHSKRLDKLGMRSSDTAQLFFDNVRVPRRFLIGEEGKGFIYQMEQFQEERLWVALSSLKGLELCVQSTIEYTSQRSAFGKRLLDNQVVQFRLAELQTEIESLRALSYQCVEQLISGEDVTLRASMAKLKCGRLAREVTDACLQYWGGMGFMWDNVVSRLYRDMRLHAIGGGSDETMLGIIAKYMGMGKGGRG